MTAAALLSPEARRTAGIILLTVVAVEAGGFLMLRVVIGDVVLTPFQSAFFRAGHAHAGVLVVFALLAQVLADAAALDGAAGSLARNAIPTAAILMPAGFFLSALGRGSTRPNAFVVLVYGAAAALAAGAVALGVGLLRA